MHELLTAPYGPLAPRAATVTCVTPGGTINVCLAPVKLNVCECLLCSARYEPFAITPGEPIGGRDPPHPDSNAAITVLHPKRAILIT
jgi:hypothetical protein